MRPLRPISKEQSPLRPNGVSELQILQAIDVPLHIYKSFADVEKGVHFFFQGSASLELGGPPNVRIQAQTMSCSEWLQYHQLREHLVARLQGACHIRRSHLLPLMHRQDGLLRAASTKAPKFC